MLTYMITYSEIKMVYTEVGYEGSLQTFSKSIIIYVIILHIPMVVYCTEWNLISQTRTTFLETYKNYIDAVVMHFDIPEDSIEAKFEFRGSMHLSSVISCPVKDIELYLQYGAPPVINPDGSKFPEEFLLDRREKILGLNLTTNKVYKYINITSPIPGSYYAAAYHPYINPKDLGITQDGLFPVCDSFIDASLYVKQLNVTSIVSEQIINVNIRPKEAELFKIYIPAYVFKVILSVKELQLCDECQEILITVYPSTTSQDGQNATINSTVLSTSYRVLGDDDYYIKITSNALSKATESYTSFNFIAKFVEVPEDDDDGLGNKEKTELKDDLVYLNATHMYYTPSHSSIAWKYNEYDLHKSLNTESFQFTYELEQLDDGSVPINVNVSSMGFSALKFNVRDVLDVGGTLNIALAFFPRFEKSKGRLYIKKEPSHHTVVVCLRRAGIEVPIWPNNCMYLDETTPSPLSLNSSVTNSSFMIPYPEPGNWYLTFKLFCGECVVCKCPQHCQDALAECIKQCEADCVDNCFECQRKCDRITIHNKKECQGCDCDGNCRNIRNKELLMPEIETTAEKRRCNTSILFDISSYPCVGNKCGSNGKCAFGFAEGFVYSTCVCINNYKGWDCMDSSNTNSLFEIWLELMLLVLSNFAFGIAVYVGYKRKYYVETLVYASILISSTFYHACDAGENRINFCLVDLDVLQFCDFYCAILSIWVTLIAMAHLPLPLPHLFHIAGAIFLGAAVTMDKTSLWVFVIPVTAGFLIVGVSWGVRNYRLRKAKEAQIKVFPSKNYLLFYLPAGLVIALVALLSFALFQTQSNYKYVHSLWHIMMAVVVVIVLPKMDVFLPKPADSNATNSTHE